MYSSKATKSRFYEANMCQKVLPPLTMELLHYCGVAQVVSQTQQFPVWKNYKQLTAKMAMRDQNTWKQVRGESAFILIPAL